MAYDAFSAVLEKRRQDMRRYEQLMPRPIATRDFEPNVITYAELYAAVKAEQGDIDARLAALARTLTEQKTELQYISIELVRCLYEQYSEAAHDNNCVHTALLSGRVYGYSRCGRA